MKFLKIYFSGSTEAILMHFFFVGSEKDWNKLKLDFWNYTNADSVDFWKKRFSENSIFYGVLCENEKILLNKVCFVLHSTHKKIWFMWI
jgi:hypothetical protein